MEWRQVVGMAGNGRGPPRRDIEGRGKGSQKITNGGRLCEKQLLSNGLICLLRCLKCTSPLS